MSSNYINIKINQNTKIKLLIDTGADISLIKKDIIPENLLFENDICRINGISDKEIISLGVSNLTLYLEDQKFKHKFYVINEEINLNTDGIIGRDFLMKYNCKIDYETCTIIIPTDTEDIILPMCMNIKNVYNINIPARSEVIKQINIKLNEDSIVLGREVKNGVFIANSIIPAFGIKHIRLLNTTDNDINLKETQLQIEALTKYDVAHLNKDKHPKFNEFKDKINIPKADNHASTSVLEICKRFQKIFHTNEPLSTNNFMNSIFQL